MNTVDQMIAARDAHPHRNAGVLADVRLKRIAGARWRARLLALSIVAGCAPVSASSADMQFSGPDIPLEQAIEADDPAAVARAIAGGASVNARGARNVTPLEFAVAIHRKKAAAALIAHHADPNLRDADGDSAVSLAVNAYRRDPSLLAMVLDGGGNPNAVRPDGDPVIVRFLNDRNLDAITYLHARGADIDAEVDGQPMVVDAAWGADWDVVWRLIELGARTDTPKAAAGLVETFRIPGATLPDSPVYPFKVKVWVHLKAQGLDPVPPAGMVRP
ncbi:hypothetical protein WS89_22285 [Burkholderia sp. MSMB1072]|uniref:ankyrin repeat domain-containing protein n=1 Tax=Burkholderia sp. MSMB1072 TaxID=1637871 RepID=UPI00075861C0|nr:ankyrin repeat domain-containing protein [Burkholderia sp. MSMB1072]KVH57062.1 hypothetical protein WS89_22285 [Burkholderia sp. MSMB1072]